MRSLHHWEGGQSGGTSVEPDLRTSQYEVRYQLAATPYSDYDEMLRELMSELRTLRPEKANIKLQGMAEQRDAAEQVQSVTAWFAARSKGEISRLNCRANLPSCGIRRTNSYE